MAALQPERRRPAACEGQAPGQPSPLGHGQIIGGIADQAAALGLHAKLLAQGQGRGWIRFAGAALGAMDRTKQMAQAMGSEKRFQAGAQIAADHGELQPLAVPALQHRLEPR